jgi:phosphoribosylaminoimidazole-succinocarboxamide synthase
MYDVGEDRLLMVASDRLSAFDVVMDRPIPRKGEVLTAVTVWWLEQLGDLVEHHLLAADPDDIVAAVPALADTRSEWAGRALLVRQHRAGPVECVVRGTSPARRGRSTRRPARWRASRSPAGSVESDRLDPPSSPRPPRPRAGHDENITSPSWGAARPELADRLRELSLAIYERGRRVAAERGIILADTKFEFGLVDDRLILIDEVMTPDSSRFWPEESYAREGPAVPRQAAGAGLPGRSWPGGASGTSSRRHRTSRTPSWRPRPGATSTSTAASPGRELAL